TGVSEGEGRCGAVCGSSDLAAEVAIVTDRSATASGKAMPHKSIATQRNVYFRIHCLSGPGSSVRQYARRTGSAATTGVRPDGGLYRPLILGRTARISALQSSVGCLISHSRVGEDCLGKSSGVS